MECRKNNRGMITIEMALLFPLLLFSVLCMCSLGLYFMDIAKLNSKVQEVLVYASESVGRGEDTAIGSVSMKKRNQKELFRVSYTAEKQELEAAIRRELANRLLYVKLDKVKIFINGSEIRATVDYRAGNSLWYWFSLREQKAVVQQDVQRICYADRLRRKEQ